MIDPLNFNNKRSTHMGFINLMRFRADCVQRNLKLNVFIPGNLEEKITELPRFYQDKNINQYNSFILNNFRK